MMWLVRIALRRPYTFVVMAMLIVILGVRHDPPDADGHLPGHRHPGHLGRLELRGPAAGGDGEAHRQQLRARAHDDGQRHRAHREPVAHRHRGHQDLLPAGREASRRRPRRSPPSRRPWSARCRRARRRRSSSATARRTCPSCRLALESDIAQRAAALRLRHQLHPRRHRDRSRARRSPGRTAASSARSWSTSTRSGSTRWGLSPRDVNDALGAAERHPADRARRRSASTSIPIVAQREPRAARRDRRPADQDRQRHARSTCATSRTCATATRRRPTWCTSSGKTLACSCRSSRTASASTLDVVERHPRRCSRRSLARLPKELKVALLFDQSIFVRAAVEGVVKEAAIAAGLTALMILLFLGSWRSTLIVVISIPLSILVSIIVLARARPDAERDDARRHGARGRHPGRRRDRRDREHPPQHRRSKKPLVRAILDGAQQIAVAGVRLDALHLHRLRAGRVHHRRGEVALRAARRWPSSSRC